jgi:hypothetical protein
LCAVPPLLAALIDGIDLAAPRSMTLEQLFVCNASCVKFALVLEFAFAAASFLPAYLLAADL